MNIDRAVMAFAGVMTLASVALTKFVSPWWWLLTAFVGLNLLQASFTGFCPAASVFLLFALLVLSACGADPAAGTRFLSPSLQTRVVKAGADTAGRAWDGVVEAVQQADLSAQTSGRVTSVEVDVDDRIAHGDVLLRITAFEQQAGMNAARARCRPCRSRPGQPAEHLYDCARTVHRDRGRASG